MTAVIFRYFRKTLLIIQYTSQNIYIYIYSVTIFNYIENCMKYEEHY
jgi:hypothetical protein